MRYEGKNAAWEERKSLGKQKAVRAGNTIDNLKKKVYNINCKNKSLKNRIKQL